MFGRVLPRKLSPPENARTFGQIGEIGIDLYVDSPALKACVEYARTKPSVMVTGVLIGDYCTWGGRDYTWIHHFIPALKAISRSASCKITQEAWQEISAIREAKYSGSPIAGWMQSHPGFGIFMSEMSMKIQREYFCLPWQVAITVDPVADNLGFFGWSGDEIKKTGFRTVSTTTNRPPGPEAGPKRPTD